MAFNTGDKVQIQETSQVWNDETKEYKTTTKSGEGVVFAQCWHPSVGEAYRVMFINKSGNLSSGGGYYADKDMKLIKANFMSVVEPDYDKLIPGLGPRKPVKEDKPEKNPLSNLSKAPETGPANEKSKSKRKGSGQQSSMLD